MYWGRVEAREVVMSDDRRRKRAVWVRAGRGVVGFWVERKAVSQLWVGCRFLVVARWVVSCWDLVLIFGG